MRFWGLGFGVGIFRFSRKFHGDFSITVLIKISYSKLLFLASCAQWHSGGLGFGVWGFGVLGFGVWGFAVLGFGVWGFGLGFRVSCLRFNA